MSRCGNAYVEPVQTNEWLSRNVSLGVSSIALCVMITKVLWHTAKFLWNSYADWEVYIESLFKHCVVRHLLNLSLESSDPTFERQYLFLFCFFFHVALNIMLLHVIVLATDQLNKQSTHRRKNLTIHFHQRANFEIKFLDKGGNRYCTITNWKSQERCPLYT